MPLRKLLLPLTMLAIALAFAAPASAADPAGGDDTVVLPTRVANAIQRTQSALANAVDHVDEAEYTKATVSLRAVRANLARADKAARRQMNAPVDPNVE